MIPDDVAHQLEETPPGEVILHWSPRRWGGHGNWQCNWIPDGTTDIITTEGPDVAEVVHLCYEAGLQRLKERGEGRRP